MPYLLPYSDSTDILPRDGNKGSILRSGGGSVHVTLFPHKTGLSLYDSNGTELPYVSRAWRGM
jgi:hypothetical protein